MPKIAELATRQLHHAMGHDRLVAESFAFRSSVSFRGHLLQREDIVVLARRGRSAVVRSAQIADFPLDICSYIVLVSDTN